MVLRDKILTGLLIFIMLLNTVDVITDYYLGIPMWHIIQESCIVLASGFGALYIIRESLNRRQHIEHLKNQLTLSHSQLAKASEEMQKARNDFAHAIQKQFGQWHLTQSEQDVALLLLKGLSLREIGEVRDTKEKTVRQQASSVYEKAGVEGRHEFAAWFLEDFVSP